MHRTGAAYCRICRAFRGLSLRLLCASVCWHTGKYCITAEPQLSRFRGRGDSCRPKSYALDGGAHSHYLANTIGAR